MVQDTPSRKLDQYIVRFPAGMRDRLKAEAAANKRSLNAEIIARLEASFPDPNAEKEREAYFLQQREETLTFNMNMMMEQLAQIQKDLELIRRQRGDSTPSGS